MPLEISYFTRAVNESEPIAGTPIVGAAQTLALTATPANSTATPGAAIYMSVLATETARFEYGVAPTAGAQSNFVALNERLWIEAVPGYVVSARTS